ncbi:MAG TPA: hypothetical protein ENJ14_00585 [Bacteroidetes bacterium]|nr:MAG: hypothetical protein DRI72_06395 [Bacteroidota bacterium]RLD70080.1 MAG: hypothetical protein DRI87_08835 [Bacteroidota bacterium]RLD87171.1 MAG: hypothetical protein DRJ02_07035 [Bacteroidota bacterium]HHL57424.1 hypothetical protein [Bacteroidota bacterium]
MKYKLFIGLFVSLFWLTSCDVLEQASDVVQFAQCDFSIDRVGMDEAGGVSLSKIQNLGDINPLDIISLTQQVRMGNLPVTMDVAIKATNNQSLKAGISGLDWELYMKDTKYGGGKLNQAVEVLPGQSTTFPVSVSFNLLKLVTTNNLQQVMDLVLHMNDREKLKQLDIKLQLKPYYKVGSSVQEYPGYITIRP